MRGGSENLEDEKEEDEGAAYSTEDSGQMLKVQQTNKPHKRKYKEKVKHTDIVPIKKRRVDDDPQSPSSTQK